MITRIAIEGYRSVRSLVTKLAPLTVITGANGAGKTNLYRAMRLLAAVGQGQVAAAVAAEGGLESLLWAGPEQGAASMIARGQPVQGTVRRKPVAVRLGFAGPDLGYAIDLGQPGSDSAFPHDPMIKAEAIWHGGTLSRHGLVAERRGPALRVLTRGAGDEGLPALLNPWDSMLTHAAALDRDGRLLEAREVLRSWRFYDGLRTDRDAPARRPAISTRTPVLAHDGADLAPAIATIFETGDRAGFAAAVASAFDGAVVRLTAQGNGLGVALQQPGLLRPVEAIELSDGTLRYLLLLAALFSPNPPGLLVFNEPEASLHPQLLAPLAAQIVAAGAATQIVVITHAAAFAEQLCAAGGERLCLERLHGETVIVDDDRPNWVWPQR
jgi:predicted ATPase